MCFSDFKISYFPRTQNEIVDSLAALLYWLFYSDLVTKTILSLSNRIAVCCPKKKITSLNSYKKKIQGEGEWDPNKLYILNLYSTHLYSLIHLYQIIISIKHTFSIQNHYQTWNTFFIATWNTFFISKVCNFRTIIQIVQF